MSENAENADLAVAAAMQRYQSAVHAMQTGVGFVMERDTFETSPKHLRVGVNSAMVEDAALAGLLIAKGLITEAEYMAAIADGMEREVGRYAERIKQTHGVDVTLV